MLPAASRYNITMMVFSFRTRLSLAVSLLVVLLLGGTAFFTLAYFEREFEHNLTLNQSTSLVYLVDDVDATLQTIQQTLQAAASVMPKQALVQPELAIDFFVNRPGLRKFFNDSLYLIAADGRICAAAPDRKTDLPRQVFQDPFFQQFLQGKQFIAGPTKSSLDPERQLVVFGAPMLSESGYVIGFLVGTFDPQGKNPLSRFADTKIGASGYIRLVTADHIIVTHPFRERILQLATPSIHGLVDKALSGKDSYGHNVNFQNREVVTSGRRLKSIEWVLLASYPFNEAFAPVQTARNYFLAAALAGLMATIWLVFVSLRYVTQPLAMLTSHVASLQQKDGDARFISLSGGEEFARLSSAFNDMVREIDQKSASLIASEERYRIVADYAGDFAYWRLPDGTFAYVAPACQEVTGYSVREFIAQPQLLDEMICPEDRPRFETCRQQDGGCTPPEEELRVVTKGGQTRWVRHTCRRIFDEQGEFLGYRGSNIDITEHKRLSEQVSHLSFYDQLTDLPNRQLFTDRLYQNVATAVRRNSTTVVVFLGLDRFKIINDAYGQEVGDVILRATASRLQAQLRGSDTVCRYGGDIFALILVDISTRRAAAGLAEKLLAVVAAPHEINGQQVGLSCSIGIALCPQDAVEAETLVRSAETAMYNAKKRGRNSFTFFTEEMNIQYLEQLKLDASMLPSLERGDFFITYQPQYDVVTRRCTGVEALIRWQHPELGLISPVRFIPLAEENGFIIPLGNWVLATVCQDCARWRQNGLTDFRVSVNISGRQFREYDFIALVQSALAETALPSAMLELELTESVLISQGEESLTRLQELKDLGIRLAIDDFGTGYSSLSYLKHFPVDRVKIDRSFVQDVTSNNDDAAIVEAIIAIARSLKLEVIAEGVETAEQSAYLAESGCPEQQGFLHCHPLREKEMLEWVAEKVKVPAKTAAATAVPS